MIDPDILDFLNCSAIILFKLVTNIYNIELFGVGVK